MGFWGTCKDDPEQGRGLGLTAPYLHTDDVPPVLVEAWLDLGQQDLEPGVHSCQVGCVDRGRAGAGCSIHPSPAAASLPGGRQSRWGRVKHDGEAEVEYKLWGSQRMEKMMGNTTQKELAGVWRGCQDWHQAVRTRCPEPCAEAHQGRKCAG